MKKIVSYFLFFFIVFGIFSPIAIAQETPGGDVDPTEKTRQVNINPVVDFKCGSNPTTWLEGCIADMGAKTLNVSGKLLYITGVLLNQSLQYTVVESSNLFGNKGVKDSWTVLRDLANIFFIFIILAIGITVILQISQWDYKKMLRDLIIMALLVNFSFFFTQVVIDVSNVVAVTTYSQLEITSGCEGEVQGVSLQSLSQKIECLDVGFTGAFMNELKLTSLFESVKFQEMVDENKSGYGVDIFMIGIFGSIFILIAAFVFLVTAVMFIVRAIVLVILLILSPLAFAAFVLPKTKTFFTEWFQKLISNAFFAPIYLILILLTLSIMREMKKGSEGNSFVEAILSGDASTSSIFIDYAIIIGFMIAALIVAKNITEKMGVYGYKGAVGFVGRNTVGRFSEFFANMARNVESSRFGTFARPLTVPLKTLGDYGARAKFGTDVSFEDKFSKSQEKKRTEAGKLGERGGPEAKRRYGKGLARFSPLPSGRATGRKIAEQADLEIARKQREEAREKRAIEARSPQTTKKQVGNQDEILQNLRNDLHTELRSAMNEIVDDADDTVSLNRIAALMVENNDIEFSSRRAIQDLAQKGDRAPEEERDLMLLMSDQVNHLGTKDIQKFTDVLQERVDEKKESASLDERGLLSRSRKEAKHTTRRINNIINIYNEAGKIQQTPQTQPSQSSPQQGNLTQSDIETIRDVVREDSDQRPQQ